MISPTGIQRLTLVAATTLTTGACRRPPPDLQADEAEFLAEMQMPAELPASPTNAKADDPAAAALGQRLFFDERLSSDGTVACASCHVPDKGFSDDSAVSRGVGQRRGGRHSMPLTAVAFQRFFFWDGRADSAWAQPIQALEGSVEMNFTRVELARAVAAAPYRAQYEAVFGPLPDLDGLPARGRPGSPEWGGMSATERDAVNRVATNVGKALEAYERRLTCGDTRFDRWARGEIELSESERAGAAQFLRTGCADCHNGPAFSDGAFHNVGIGSGGPKPDRGRETGIAALLADPFNGAGAYSDDRAAGEALLDEVAEETATAGAFRTPTLRGVAQRRFFGHRGHQEDLGTFIDHVYDRPGLEDGAVGTLDPDMLDLGNFRGVGDLVAFLRTLDCPPPAAELLSHEGPDPEGPLGAP